MDFVENSEDVIQSIACDLDLQVDECSANILRIDGQAVDASRRHLQSSQIGVSLLYVEYEVYIRASNSAIQALIDNTIYDQVVGNLCEAINDGALVGQLAASSGELAILLEDCK